MENSIKLKEYLKKYKIRQGELADFLLIEQSNVSCIVNGVKRPSINTAALIEVFTKSEIKTINWSEYAKTDCDHKTNIFNKAGDVHAKADSRRIKNAKPIIS